MFFDVYYKCTYRHAYILGDRQHGALVVVVQLLSYVQLHATPWTAARQDSLSFTSPGACLTSCPLCRWCHPTILSSVVPFSSCLQSFRASGSFPLSWLFSLGDQSIGASALSPSNEYSGLIFFRIDWFDLLAVWGTLERLLQHQSSKASILQCSAFLMI